MELHYHHTAFVFGPVPVEEYQDLSPNPMEMKKYELMVIVNNQITGGEVEKRLREIKALLPEVVFEEIWGVRPFAYPIKGHEKGYYAVWNFMIDPSDIYDLERTLGLFPDLIRFLLLQVPEDYKPFTLAEIDAGLEKLKEEKAQKRGALKPATERRKPEDRKFEERRPEERKFAPRKTEEAPKAVEKTPAEASAEAKPSSEAPAPAKKTKTLDEKLQDILSDDDLGL